MLWRKSPNSPSPSSQTPGVGTSTLASLRARPPDDDPLADFRLPTLRCDYPELLPQLRGLWSTPEQLRDRIDRLLYHSDRTRPLKFQALVELAEIKDRAQARIKGFPRTVWDNQFESSRGGRWK